MNDTRTHLAHVLTDLEAVVGRITPEQLDAPTPCTAFTVADLLDHTVGWLENFAAGYADPNGNCPRPDVTDVSVDLADAPQRIRAAAATLDAALAEGAAERDFVIPGQGGMPGGMALSMILGEYLVHGWDLAAATGQHWSADPEAAAASREFLEMMVTPDSRGPEAMFDAEVPVDPAATQLDRLLGFAGRDPGWTSGVAA